MKSCPTCQLSFKDDSLEFCLDDGSRLVSMLADADDPQTMYSEQSRRNAFISAQTMPNSAPITAIGGEDARTMLDSSPNSGIGETSVLNEAVASNPQLIAVGAITLALAHNYWQWLYMSEYRTVSEFIWTFNFIIWFLLLAGGIALSLQTLKRNTVGKGYAIISLVVLAINLLLIVVPRR